MSEAAGYMSLDELEVGRSPVVILFPGSNWSPVAFDMGTPLEGVFLRFANSEASLKSLPVQTLIVVAALKMPENGLRLMVEKMSGQIEPKMIVIWGDARPDSTWIDWRAGLDEIFYQKRIDGAAH